LHRHTNRLEDFADAMHLRVFNKESPV